MLAKVNTVNISSHSCDKTDLASAGSFRHQHKPAKLKKQKRNLTIIPPAYRIISSMMKEISLC